MYFQLLCFLVNFAKLLRTPPYECFWIDYKYNNNKMIKINKKHNYILLHFIQFSKQMFLLIAIEGDIQKQLLADVLQRSSTNICSIALTLLIVVS